MVRERSAARLATRCLFELLDAALDLIETLVGLLRRLIGGLCALRRALHLHVELVEAGVDRCKLVFVGRTGTQAHGSDKRHSKRTRGRQVLFGQNHCTASFLWGVRTIAAFTP